MGYPMTYQRVISRNRLHGGYSHDAEHPPEAPALEMLCGDLRRLEHDQRDAWHLERYALAAGITPEQAKAVLDAFFDDSAPYPPHEATSETNALRLALEQAQECIGALRSMFQSLHGWVHLHAKADRMHEQLHHMDEIAGQFNADWMPLFYTREEEAARSVAKA